MERAYGVPVLMANSYPHWLKPYLTAALVLLGGIWSASCLAELSEEQAKTSLIYNLTKFVQWPEQPQDKFLNICVYRDDPIVSVLGGLRDKTSKGLSLRVRKVDTLDGVQTCQILYIGRREQSSLRVVLQALSGRGVLVVSDIPESAAGGAMVEIMLDNNRLSFSVNKKTASEANLKLPAQVLSLAKVVYD